jgi:hypothetical protein
VRAGEILHVPDIIIQRRALNNHGRCFDALGIDHHRFQAAVQPYLSRCPLLQDSREANAAAAIF